MRVEFSPADFSLPREITARATSPSQDFAISLADMKKIYLREELDDKLQAIQEQGRRLCRKMTLGDLKKFKQMVAEFLQFCLSKGLKLNQERLSSGSGKTKLLYIIETVDKKLLELAEELFSQNRDSLKIMALVDEIRGLLLDLYA